MSRKRALSSIERQALVGKRGWSSRSTVPTPYWCDACQLGDAMYQPFVAALQARFAHRAGDIETRACVRTGKTLAELDAKACSDARGDTGLRVMGNPVWRYQSSGVCVCEVLAGDCMVLIYEPEVLMRRSARKLQEEKS